MSDQRIITFQPDPEAADAVAAERKRLAKRAGKGTFVGKAEAVRSLIHKASAIKDKVDA